METSSSKDISEMQLVRSAVGGLRQADHKSCYERTNFQQISITNLGVHGGKSFKNKQRNTRELSRNRRNLKILVANKSFPTGGLIEELLGTQLKILVYSFNFLKRILWYTSYK